MRPSHYSATTRGTGGDSEVRRAAIGLNAAVWAMTVPARTVGKPTQEREEARYRDYMLWLLAGPAAPAASRLVLGMFAAIGAASFMAAISAGLPGTARIVAGVVALVSISCTAVATVALIRRLPKQ